MTLSDCIVFGGAGPTCKRLRAGFEEYFIKLDYLIPVCGAARNQFKFLFNIAPLIYFKTFFILFYFEDLKPNVSDPNTSHISES